MTSWKESLYKLRVRESEKLKTVLELCNSEIHQKNAKPDYHRLKTTVKRSIEQYLRSRNFEARDGKIEANTLVKNQMDNVVFKKGEENVGNGRPAGSVRKETSAVSGTMGTSVQKPRHRQLLLRNLRRNRKM